MVQEIIWSPIAIETFDNIINYLFKNFGEKSAREFAQRVDAKLKLIQSRPKMFRRSGNRQIHISPLSGAKQLLPTGIKKLRIKLNL